MLDNINIKLIPLRIIISITLMITHSKWNLYIYIISSYLFILNSIVIEDINFYTQQTSKHKNLSCDPLNNNELIQIYYLQTLRITCKKYFKRN